jgi:InsA N-terminal domain
MALVHVHCPQCQSIDVVQYGKQAIHYRTHFLTSKLKHYLPDTFTKLF